MQARCDCASTDFPYHTAADSTSEDSSMIAESAQRIRWGRPSNSSGVCRFLLLWRLVGEGTQPLTQTCRRQNRWDHRTAPFDMTLLSYPILCATLRRPGSMPAMYRSYLAQYCAEYFCGGATGIQNLTAANIASLLLVAPTPTTAICIIFL